MSDGQPDMVGELRELARGLGAALAQSSAALIESEAARANLEAVIAEARAHAATMARGVGYRVSGDHDTWDQWHEGKSDMADEIDALLERAGDPVVLREHDAKVLRDAADGISEVGGVPGLPTTIWGFKAYLTARADVIEKGEGS